MKICEFITLHYYTVGFILIVRHQCVVMKSLKIIKCPTGKRYTRQ